ncbi:MAG: hypothetical protein U9R33_01410 [candidate division NC10 bacterium]|nr:hypothetical protein [candidate division NC10 bacterium]
MPHRQQRYVLIYQPNSGERPRTGEEAGRQGMPGWESLTSLAGGPITDMCRVSVSSAHATAHRFLENQSFSRLQPPSLSIRVRQQELQEEGDTIR